METPTTPAKKVEMIAVAVKKVPETLPQTVTVNDDHHFNIKNKLHIKTIS